MLSTCFQRKPLLLRPHAHAESTDYPYYWRHCDVFLLLTNQNAGRTCKLVKGNDCPAPFTDLFCKQRGWWSCSSYETALAVIIPSPLLFEQRRGQTERDWPPFAWLVQHHRLPQSFPLKRGEVSTPCHANMVSYCPTMAPHWPAKRTLFIWWRKSTAWGVTCGLQERQQDNLVSMMRPISAL